MFYCLVDVDGTLMARRIVDYADQARVDLDDAPVLNEQLIQHLKELQAIGAQIYLFSSMEVAVEQAASAASSRGDYTRHKLIHVLGQKGLHIKGLIYPASLPYQETTLGEAYQTLFTYYPDGPQQHVLRGLDLKDRDQPSLLFEDPAAARLRLSELFDKLPSIYMFALLDNQNGLLEDFLLLFHNFYLTTRLNLQSESYLLDPALQEKLSTTIDPVLDLFETYKSILTRANPNTDPEATAEAEESEISRKTALRKQLYQTVRNLASASNPTYQTLLESHTAIADLAQADHGRAPEKVEMYCAFRNIVGPLTPQDTVIVYDDKKTVIDAMRATHHDLHAAHPLMTLQIPQLARGTNEFLDQTRDYIRLYRQLLELNNQFLLTGRRNAIKRVTAALSADSPLKELIVKMAQLLETIIQPLVTATPLETTATAEQMRAAYTQTLTGLTLTESTKSNILALLQTQPGPAREAAVPEAAVAEPAQAHQIVPLTSEVLDRQIHLHLPQWLELATQLQEAATTPETKKQALSIKLNVFYSVYAEFAGRKTARSAQDKRTHLNQTAILIQAYNNLDELLSRADRVMSAQQLRNLDRLLNTFIHYLLLLTRSHLPSYHALMIPALEQVQRALQSVNQARGANLFQSAAEKEQHALAKLFTTFTQAASAPQSL